jgi:hypothetical protein
MNQDRQIYYQEKMTKAFQDRLIYVSQDFLKVTAVPPFHTLLPILQHDSYSETTTTRLSTWIFYNPDFMQSVIDDINMYAQQQTTAELAKPGTKYRCSSETVLAHNNYATMFTRTVTLAVSNL